MSLSRDLGAHDAARTKRREAGEAQVRRSGGWNAERIVLIEKRLAIRECIAAKLGEIIGANVVTFETVEEWLASGAASHKAVVLLSVSGSRDCEFGAALELLVANHSAAVVVFGESDDPKEIAGALRKGARGYVATSMAASQIAQALCLVAQGGRFVPAESLIAACCKPPDSATHHSNDQAAIAEALCNGKPNKVIANELNMSESAVKMHVRNIMKRFKATNRTQVAIRLRSLEGRIP